jgi:hypothetical protein
MSQLIEPSRLAPDKTKQASQIRAAPRIASWLRQTWPHLRGRCSGIARNPARCSLSPAAKPQTLRESSIASSRRERGGGLDAFDQAFGPVDKVQGEWHTYVRRLKTALSKGDVQFFKYGHLPDLTNATAKP